LQKWQSPYIIQPKLDGDRCRACIDSDGKAILLSSEENIFASVPHINRALEALHLRNVEFDGELYVHGAPHYSIHSIVSRSMQNRHVDYNLMEYHIFDVVASGYQLQRTAYLMDLQVSHPLYIVHTEVVEDMDAIQRFADKMATQNYEGFILRNPAAVYVRKRSINMMKFKPRKEDIYEVVGYTEEIDKHGVPKATLGAVICKGDDGTEFPVGSGSFFTQQHRFDYWQIRETLAGQYMAKIKYQHMHPSGHPRHAVLCELINKATLFQ
jgi:ATP-dependent DNA ligase